MEHIQVLFILRTQNCGGIQSIIWTNKRIRYTSSCSSCMANFWSTFWGNGMRVLHRVVNVKPCIRLRLELQYCGAKFYHFIRYRYVGTNGRMQMIMQLQWTGWSSKALFAKERIIISREACLVIAYVQMLTQLYANHKDKEYLYRSQILIEVSCTCVLIYHKHSSARKDDLVTSSELYVPCLNATSLAFQFVYCSHFWTPYDWEGPGDRNDARFSAPVHTSPGAHSAFFIVGIRSLSWA
jgi:hypothetical protein